MVAGMSPRRFLAYAVWAVPALCCSSCSLGPHEASAVHQRTFDVVRGFSVDVTLGAGTVTIEPSADNKVHVVAHVSALSKSAARASDYLAESATRFESDLEHVRIDIGVAGPSKPDMTRTHLHIQTPLVGRMSVNVLEGDVLIGYVYEEGIRLRRPCAAESVRVRCHSYNATESAIALAPIGRPVRVDAYVSKGTLRVFGEDLILSLYARSSPEFEQDARAQFLGERVANGEGNLEIRGTINRHGSNIIRARNNIDLQCSEVLSGLLTISAASIAFDELMLSYPGLAMSRTENSVVAINEYSQMNPSIDVVAGGGVRIYPDRSPGGWQPSSANLRGN